VIDPAGVPAEARPPPATPKDEMTLTRYPRLKLPVRLRLPPLPPDKTREPGRTVPHPGYDPGIPIPILWPQQGLSCTEPHGRRLSDRRRGELPSRFKGQRREDVRLPGLPERLGMDGPPDVTIAAGGACMVPVAAIPQPLFYGPGAHGDRLQPEVMASDTAEGLARGGGPDASPQHAPSPLSVTQHILEHSIMAIV
jgi:hypothetical protein